ncbi:hypothetical protein BX600DRAFT_237640 [Xylariales sp. PMI_506]|nr:hypothetical protein BX600DRAFT_237640 [Xylariales sp. PMI_506]
MEPEHTNKRAGEFDYDEREEAIKRRRADNLCHRIEQHAKQTGQSSRELFKRVLMTEILVAMAGQMIDARRARREEEEEEDNNRSNSRRRQERNTRKIEAAEERKHGATARQARQEDLEEDDEGEDEQEAEGEDEGEDSDSSGGWPAFETHEERLKWHTDNLLRNLSNCILREYREAKKQAAARGIAFERLRYNGLPPAEVVKRCFRALTAFIPDFERAYRAEVIRSPGDDEAPGIAGQALYESRRHLILFPKLMQARPSVRASAPAPTRVPAPAPATVPVSVPSTASAARAGAAATAATSTVRKPVFASAETAASVPAQQAADDVDAEATEGEEVQFDIFKLTLPLLETCIRLTLLFTMDTRLPKAAQ